MVTDPQKSYLRVLIAAVLFWHMVAPFGYAQDKTNVQSVQGLTVFDSDGKKIGPVLSLFGPTAAVALRFRGELVLLGVDRDLFTELNGFAMRFSSLLFESANCTGTPFFPSAVGFQPALAPFHILDGSKVYAGEAAAKSIVVRSVGSSSYPNTCDITSPSQRDAVPLRLLGDLSKVFTPPFSLKAAP